MKLDDGIVHIFTDGSCVAKTGAGGWGGVLLFNGNTKEVYGGVSGTTTGAMELMAIEKSLAVLRTRKHPIVVYSDSKYSVNALSMWWRGWQANGWYTNSCRPVKNKQIIQRILFTVGVDNVAFRWVKGHSGIEHNERADELARIGRLEHESNDVYGMGKA